MNFIIRIAWKYQCSYQQLRKKVQQLLGIIIINSYKYIYKIEKRKSIIMDITYLELEDGNMCIIIIVSVHEVLLDTTWLECHMWAAPYIWWRCNYNEEQ